ncbi:MAG: sulfite exporter TauE/SafE family protein [Luteibacter sp.]
MFLAILFACTIAAFTVSAVSGGGAGLVLMPVLRAGLPMAQVPVALSLGSAVSSLTRIGVFVRHTHWGVVRWFVPSSLPGALLGAWLLQRANPAYAELAVGVFLVANLPMLWRKPRAVVAKRPPARGLLTLIGFVAGFVSGFTGAVGLLFNGFYLQQGLSREQLVATRAANEIALHIVKLILYAYFGLVTNEAMVAGAVLGAAAVVATLAARYVLPLLSESVFRRVGYASMVVAGMAMLDGSTSDLAARHGVALHASRVPGGLDARAFSQRSARDLP